MMGKMVKRWRWALLVAALLVGGLVFAFWPTPQTVDTARVTRGAMSVGVTDDGITRAVDYYIVAAPVTGYLSRIELEPGDRVERGALIAHMSGRPAAPLDPRSRQELLAALAAATAAVQGADASLAQAQNDLRRAEQLAARGFVAKAQLEAARTRATTGQAMLAQSRAEAARLRAALAQPVGSASGGVPIRAPAGGSVLSVITESEGVIAEASPLVTIGDPRRIELVVDLLSREAVQVTAGNRVEVTQWGGSQPLIGHVERVEPFGRLKISALGIEEQRVNVIVRFDDLPDRDAARLGHGFQVDATIIRWSRPDALRVPIGALFRGIDGGWQVFVIAKGRAVARSITLGHINDAYGEVTAGLRAGDEVVMNPPASLDDGASVRAR
ncbi:efflux RND transporter periplasmic adaptor subunit [Sphingopyxis sp.]|uniref:efflux RND transporter periplasmic adaptor subunit n=1 Tax=Sphingopyxis sp. TaxID=1908224 RepID=UPI001D37CD1F|nr:efflux RND transporter periplasmic adaptor subunit [Sphingopyxis sp.]MBW8297940.1 efflux RND transporter periplasmic adaptor subunit [Sphingopyxis sp.]